MQAALDDARRHRRLRASPVSRIAPKRRAEYLSALGTALYTTAWARHDVRLPPAGLCVGILNSFVPTTGQ